MDFGLPVEWETPRTVNQSTCWSGWEVNFVERTEWRTKLLKLNMILNVKIEVTNWQIKTFTFTSHKMLYEGSVGFRWEQRLTARRKDQPRQAGTKWCSRRHWFWEKGQIQMNRTSNFSEGDEDNRVVYTGTMCSPQPMSRAWGFVMRADRLLQVVHSSEFQRTSPQ